MPVSGDSGERGVSRSITTAPPARLSGSGRRGTPRRSAGVVLVVVGLLAGCGFHLRGTGGNMDLPPSLSVVRVIMAGPSANEPLAVAVREALTQAGARVVETNEAPTLSLLGEHIESRVASVSTTTAKAAEYLLQYGATFRLDGSYPVPSQTVRLQRDYSFDPARVLAKEQQEQELVRDMRREAAQQIVRRLVRALTPNTR